MIGAEHPSPNPCDTHDAAGISRRRFVQVLGAYACELMLSRNGFAAGGDLDVEFTHGVASGDPLADRVVIWTRAVSSGADDFYVLWLVATDPGMRQVITGGLAKASAGLDHTVKVDVGGLQSNTTYYYQFVYRRHRSPVGKTRTLARGHLERTRFAFVSCANHPKGYFHAYKSLAEMEDVEFILHLGDYIYEYGQDGYRTAANRFLGRGQPRLRQLEPIHECVTLDDYRKRYALYRSDLNLQQLHRKKPFICIWDDHEIANNCWRSGAENHTREEGDWTTRTEAAIRAYYEWLPIRESDSAELTAAYRSFALGDLARLVILETRLDGRDKQLNSEALRTIHEGTTGDGEFPLDVTDEGRLRSMLGPEQKAWLRQEMTLAGEQQTWQLLGQQILFFFQRAPDFENSTLLTEEQKKLLMLGLDLEFGAGTGELYALLGETGGPNPIAADTWTGYPSARRELAELLAQAPNPVLLTGDSHSSWAANLKLHFLGGDSVPIGVEFAGTSISSPGLEEELIVITPQQIADLAVEASHADPAGDELVYVDIERRGFVVLDVTHDRVAAEYYLLNTVLDSTFELTLDAVLMVDRDARRIKKFEQ